jgi:hypothetical protein
MLPQLLSGMSSDCTPSELHFSRPVRPNKAMKPTEQGDSSQGVIEAMQKRLVSCRRSLGLVAASTNILPPQLIAGVRWRRKRKITDGDL